MILFSEFYEKSKGDLSSDRLWDNLRIQRKEILLGDSVKEWTILGGLIPRQPLKNLYIIAQLMSNALETSRQEGPENLRRVQDAMSTTITEPLIRRAARVEREEQLQPFYAALLGTVYENEVVATREWEQLDPHGISNALSSQCALAATYFLTLIGDHQDRLNFFVDRPQWFACILDNSHKYKEWFDLLQSIMAYLCRSNRISNVFGQLTVVAKKDFLIAIVEVAFLNEPLRKHIIGTILDLLRPLAKKWVTYQNGDEESEEVLSFILDLLCSVCEEFSCVFPREHARNYMEVTHDILIKCNELVEEMTAGSYPKGKKNQVRLVLLDVRKGTVRFLGFLAKGNQDLIRETHNLDLVLPLTSISDTDSTLYQWALLTFSVAMKDCPENQTYVASLAKKQ